MIEILRILITILGSAMVQGPEQGVNMISFNGDADSPYFVGKTLPGGVDTQNYFKSAGEGQMPSGSLSARYILEGTDYTGEKCKIYIENNGKFGEPFTHPRITTDSKALASLNKDNLLGKLDNENGKLIIRIYEKLTEVPQCVRNAESCKKDEANCEKKEGRIEQFNYTAKMNGKKCKKRAQVYLPYGYDAKDKATKYNVLYLMHGGGDNTTSFLTPPKDWLPLKRVLDRLIAQGKMQPIIVVCPTFYQDDQNIGKNRMEDAIAQTRDFNKELRNYLIPTVEKADNSYYTGKGKNAIEESRSHRAFGGFSMGALCTWYQLAYDVAAVSRFLPLSGDLWTYDAENNKLPADVSAKWLCLQLKESPYANDFQIFAYTGTEDIAGKPETELINALYNMNSPMFSPKNMQFGVKQGGQHFYGHINEYLYHALPLLWK